MDDLEEKKRLIQQRDKDGTLIYRPPHEETIFTISELEELLSGLKGFEVPEDKRNPVQTSHWIKSKALELLGYNGPSGFRTKVAKKHKPKFIHQVMDLFAQSSSNLQIWGYIPYTDAEIEADWRTDTEYDYSDIKIIIVRHEDYIIRGVRIVEASELASWDNTGTETFKWQGFIPDSFRGQSILRVGDTDPIFDTVGFNTDNLETIEERMQRIEESESASSSTIAVDTPNPSLLLTIDEIGELVRPLIGHRLPDKGERVTGQLFEKKVARQLGYEFNDSELSADTGSFPDIRHQFIETKFQDSPTIDLGRHHPDDEQPLEGDWKSELAPNDARYLIGLADDKGNEYEITGIIVVSGSEFNEYFGITEGTNSKVQMTIPNFSDIGSDDITLKKDGKSQSGLSEFE